MSKRKQEDGHEGGPEQKQRKGFSVGPQSLPDGTYRRKTQKIKDDLIQKAKVKKAYAKVKSNATEEHATVQAYDPYAESVDPTRHAHEDASDRENAHDTEIGGEIHPERQAMLDQLEIVEPEFVPRRNRDRKPRTEQPRDNEKNANFTKPIRFQKEYALAEVKKTDIAERQAAREQRDKERRAMTKAKKPGKDGKPKLGRQSDVLLSRVQRLVGKS